MPAASTGATVRGAAAAGECAVPAWPGPSAAGTSAAKNATRHSTPSRRRDETRKRLRDSTRTACFPGSEVVGRDPLGESTTRVIRLMTTRRANALRQKENEGSGRRGTERDAAPAHQRGT